MKFRQSLAPLHVTQGLSLIPFKDRLLVDGAARILQVRLNAPQAVICHLVAMVAAHHTREAILAELPEEHREAAAGVLAVLITTGVLLETPTAPLVLSPTELYFQRVSFGEGPASTITTAWNKTVHVLLFCHHLDYKYAAALSDLLCRSGTTSSTASLLDMSELYIRMEKLDALTQVVSIATSEHTAWITTEVAKKCRQDNRTSLRLRLSESHGRADVGPLYTPLNQGCVQCFDEMHPFVHDDAEDVIPFSVTLSNLFWLGHAAMEILALLHAPARALSKYGARRFSLRSGHATLLRCTRLPTCKHMYVSAHKDTSFSQADHYGSDLYTTSALVFEDYMRIDTAPYDLDKITWEQLNPLWLAHTPARTYRAADITELGSDVISIPSVRNLFSLDTPAPRHHALTIAELSATLAFSARIYSSGEEILRAAPSAGNLGSTDLFILVRVMDGLDPALYYYQPGLHSLAAVRLHHHSATMTEEVETITGVEGAALPEVLLIFTGSLTRLVHKYGAFAYKLLHLDTGTSLFQAQVSLRSHGIACDLREAWNEGMVSRILGLNTPTERPTAVVELWPSTAPDVRRTARINFTTAAMNWKEARYFGNQPLRFTFERLIAESEFGSRDLGGESIHRLRKAVCGGSQYSVDLSANPIRHAVGARPMVRRRSMRQFAAAPLSLDQVSTMLSAFKCSSIFIQNQVPSWPPGLTLCVAADNISGLRRGIYSFCPSADRLVLLSEMDSSTYKRCFIQDDVRSAAALFFCVGDLLGATSGSAEQQHRRALLQAGASLNAISWTASALDLGSCYLGGAVSGILLSSLRETGEGVFLLCSLAVGIPLAAVARSGSLPLQRESG